MARLFASLLLLFTLTNCGSTTVSASGGRGELGEVPRVTAGGTYAGEDSSTEDIDFEIVQAETPMVFSVDHPIDVRFDISIKNRLQVPVRIERIGLQGASTSYYALEARSRPFKKTIAPGSTEKLEFWTSVRVTDVHVGAESPVVIRATVHMKPGEDDKARREHFTRQINGRVTIRIAGN